MPAPLTLADLPELLATLSDRLATMTPERGLRAPDVAQRIGLSVSRLYELIEAKQFPPPRRIGRASLWLESEVTAWLRGLER